uniref:Orthodenticle homeobox 1 n=1 Tax=Ascaris lumbricoides TaxID=6252 RepID=A0A0M3IXH6_ASCLU
MMSPMCQAELYGSNFHAAHAAAAVASGHSWPYAYPQQYPFGTHPYPGAMVADMTALAGQFIKHFCTEMQCSASKYL